MLKFDVLRFGPQGVHGEVQDDEWNPTSQRTAQMESKQRRYVREKFEVCGTIHGVVEADYDAAKPASAAQHADAQARLGPRWVRMRAPRPDFLLQSMVDHRVLHGPHDRCGLIEHFPSSFSRSTWTIGGFLAISRDLQAFLWTRGFSGTIYHAIVRSDGL